MHSGRRCNAAVLPAIALLLSLFLAQAATSSPRPAPTLGGTAAAARSSAPRAPAAPAVVLYDQYDTQAASDITSQDFEVALDGFDSFAADDFVVPSGQSWSITGVDVDGEYTTGGGPAASVNVFFYTNGVGSLPGAPRRGRVAPTRAQPATSWSRSVPRSRSLRAPTGSRSRLVRTSPCTGSGSGTNAPCSRIRDLSGRTRETASAPGV